VSDALPVRVTPAEVFEVAKAVERLGDDLTFKHAYALSRLVLELGGGPVKSKGRRAPIDSRTAGALRRRGYVEPGGNEQGRRQYVSSVMNFARDQPSWTATASQIGAGRLTAFISASDEGVELVGEAWKQVGRGVERAVKGDAPSSLLLGVPAAADAVNTGHAINEGQGALDLSGVQCWDLFDSRQDDELANCDVSTAPVPLADLEIRPGADGAEEVLLVATLGAATREVSEQLAASWATAWGEERRPWIAFAATEAAFSTVHRYYDEALGRDDDHDQLMADIEVLLPLGRCALTSVRFDPELASEVRLEPDPPYEREQLVRACLDGFKDIGVSVYVPDLSFESLFNVGPVDPYSGDRWFEQVLGWDDIYSAEQWDHLRNAARLEVTIPMDLLVTPGTSVSEFAAVIPRARQISLTLPAQDEAMAEYYEDLERELRERQVSALLKPLNWDDFLDGATPVTETLPAFEGGKPIRPKTSHIFDRCVRQWLDLDADDLLYAPSPDTVAISVEVPPCDERIGGMFRCQMAARYDMPVETRRGTVWGNYCASHARQNGLVRLGTGLGQYLLHPDELTTGEWDELDHELECNGTFEGFVEPEPEWSRTYRAFGFARVSETKLVKRTDAVTLWVEQGTHGELRLRRLSARTLSDGGYDRLVPSDWPAELVREVLFNLLQIDSRTLPGTPEGLGFTLTEAEAVVRDGLNEDGQERWLSDYLADVDRDKFYLQYDKSPFQHASEIVVEHSSDHDLLRDVFLRHSDVSTRGSVLRRADCPDDILRLATEDSFGRSSILWRKTLPDDVAALLFEQLALSSAAAEEQGTMLRAATHPNVPLSRVLGLAEKALFERDDRLALLDAAVGLDPDRRGALWLLVLGKTHRGKRQDEVMDRILGERGLANTDAIKWLEGMPAGAAKQRAVKWLHARCAERRQDLTDLLQARQAEAGAIASSFEVDSKGRFVISSAEYKAYRQAVEDVKVLKRLLETMPAETH
jgi:hypothetical protein